MQARPSRGNPQVSGRIDHHGGGSAWFLPDHAAPCGRRKQAATCRSSRTWASSTSHLLDWEAGEREPRSPGNPVDHLKDPAPPPGGRSLYPGQPLATNMAAIRETGAPVMYARNSPHLCKIPCHDLAHSGTTDARLYPSQPRTIWFSSMAAIRNLLAHSSVRTVPPSIGPNFGST